LRYHNIYGPRMPRDTPYAGVASIFRSALERGEAPRVLEDGCQRRDFVHVTDVAAANVRALTTDPQAGGLTAVNVCSGEPHTIGDLAGALAAATAGPEPVVVGGARPGDVRHVVADPAERRRCSGSGPQCASPRGCAPSPPIRCALRPGPPTSPNGKRPEAVRGAVTAEDRGVDGDPEIILPCLDEADALPVVLAALPAGWPVLVVDNGSTDATAAVARALGARVVAEPRRGYGAAVHAGLEAAHAELVAVLDGDGSIDPEVLPGMAALVTAGKADLAVGRRVPQSGAWPLHARAGNAHDRVALRRRGVGPRPRACPGGEPGRAARAGRRRPELRLSARTAAAGRGGGMADPRGPGALPGPGRRTVESLGLLRGTVRAARDMAGLLR
jgi:dTDP-L-rhamnose 4-epimerase